MPHPPWQFSAGHHLSYSALPLVAAGSAQLPQLPSQARAVLTLGIAQGLRVFNTGHFVQASLGARCSGTCPASWLLRSRRSFLIHPLRMPYCPLLKVDKHRGPQATRGAPSENLWQPGCLRARGLAIFLGVAGGGVRSGVQKSTWA